MSFISQSLILTGVIAGLVGCSNDSANSFKTPLNEGAGIIRGAKAAPEDAISKITVMVGLPNGNLCSGVLLNDHVVLTAAHCLRYGDKGYRVRLPEAPAGEKCAITEAVEVARPAVVDQEELLPDFGLLRLKTPLCTGGLGKVVLGSEVKVNDVLRVAGFGTGTTPNRPDYIDMTVMSSDMQTLKDLYTTNGKLLEGWEWIESYQKPYSENFIFSLANDPTKTTCNGDSGGPVYREAQGVIYLVGVVRGALMHEQKGVPDCEYAYVLLAANIAPYVGWIQDTIKNW